MLTIINPKSCLDDEELEFLGVSWTDYASLAEHIGIDVLRCAIMSHI